MEWMVGRMVGRMESEGGGKDVCAVSYLCFT